MLKLVKNAVVVGYSRSQFDANGQTVYGYNVAFTFPLSGEGSSGSGVGSFWLSKNSFDAAYIEVGSAIDVARVRVGDRNKFELVI